jgi:hypothetical protein
MKNVEGNIHMQMPRTLIALSFLVAVSASGAARADDASGNYSLTGSHGASCSVTLASDGSAVMGSDCPHVSRVTHWRSTNTGIQLQDNSRSTVAVLNKQDDGYKGGTFPEQYPLTLTKNGETVASH